MIARHGRGPDEARREVSRRGCRAGEEMAGGALMV